MRSPKLTACGWLALTACDWLELTACGWRLKRIALRLAGLIAGGRGGRNLFDTFGRPN